MAISKFANLSINSCTSKNKRSKEEKLNLKDKIYRGDSPYERGGDARRKFELNP